MLKHFGVTPYIIFDGDYLPSKAVTEIEREKKRTASRKLGLELYRMNKISQAHSELQKAVDVTPEMARQFIEELKKNNIQYIVAPYEADAQLVFLEKKNIIHGILSEDSDMLVFGAQRLLTKLDQYGDCVLFRRARFTACREVNLAAWSDKEFRTMAIMSGCDYLPSIDKMGLKTAHRLVRKYKTIEKILKMLAFDGKFRVPACYLENFQKAELTFVYQRVFCPDLNRLIMANELKAYDHELALRLGNLDFIGKDVDPHVALGVARGDLHPMTKKPLGSARRESLKSISGSRFSNSPRTPLSSSRRYSALNSTDLKSNKSITSYLQPGRTPLAEISPNEWRSSPAVTDVMRYEGEAISDILGSFVIPTSRTNVTPVRSGTSGSRLHLSSSSQQQPTPNSTPAPRFGKSRPATHEQKIPNPTSNQAKRQRLCEDPAEAEILPIVSCSEVTKVRSRFFASSTPDRSPSMIPKRGCRKIEREIIVWSDEPEGLDDSKASFISESPDTNASGKSIQTSVTHAEKGAKATATLAMRDTEVLATYVKEIKEDSRNSPPIQPEEQGKDATDDKMDAESYAAMHAKDIETDIAKRGEENEECKRESDSDEVVAVLESPVATGFVSIECKGSEDAMVPDSEDDDEADLDTDSQAFPNLDLGKFLFRC